MRVLVTGATSLIGSALARRLAERGDRVTVLQRRPAGLGLPEVLADVADPAAVRAAVGGQDAVVHLAAKVNVVGAWRDYARTNVEGTRTVLQAAREAGVRRLVHVSSPSVAHGGAALVGAAADPADPAQAGSSYARSKALAELLALQADGSGLAVAVVRPHLVWGPGDTQLVGRILARARTGRLPVIGSGAALIDTTYLDNAVDALVAALDRCELVHGEPLVVSNGEPRPVGELVAGICRAAGAPPPRWHVPRAVAWAAGGVAEAAWAMARPGGDPPLTRFVIGQLSTAHWFDQRRTRELLDWVPRVSLDEGLARLADES